MFLKRRIVKNKQAKVKYTEYLDHEREPKRLKNYNIASDVKAELLANRFFLKRRVWKNMKKIKRSSTLIDRCLDEPRSRAFRPHHSHLKLEHLIVRGLKDGKYNQS